MPNGSKAQILVVDDEPGIRETLGMLFTSAGYDVVVAENGVRLYRTWIEQLQT